jgi:hypothetical protein
LEFNQELAASFHGVEAVGVESDFANLGAHWPAATKASKWARVSSRFLLQAAALFGAGAAERPSSIADSRKPGGDLSLDKFGRNA